MVKILTEKELEENWRKAIPSKVFFNHFYSLCYHIESSIDKYDLKVTPFFNSLKLRNPNFEIDTVRKLLWNSWSTEYAFSINEQINNDAYYRFALHWNFPQAYYSVYLTMTAFHETQGIANDQHEKSIKIFGNSIKDNHYPKSLSFYSKGLYEDFEYIGLPQFQGFPDKYNGLVKIDTIVKAQTQIASFLKSTRQKNAITKQEKLRITNDKRFLNKKGIFRKNFNKEHWDIIYQTLPETTILNLLYRLRIKANYLDIETFINAEIDFKVFHQCLGYIIGYLNFVHEAYIVKVIGKEAYENILNDFPNHLNKETAIKRYNELIK